MSITKEQIAIYKAARLAQSTALFLELGAFTADSGNRKNIKLNAELSIDDLLNGPAAYLDAEKVEIVSAFPHDRAYIQNLLKLYKNGRFLVVEKARQMTVSWLFAAIFVHEILTRPNEVIFSFAQDEDKAIEFIQRCKIIVNNIPEAIWPSRLRPAAVFTQLEVSVPSMNSRIKAMTSSGVKGHGYTPTKIFLDEFSYHPNAREAYHALASGALANNTKIIAVSTPAPTFGKDKENVFFDLCDDTLDDNESCRIPFQEISTGMSARINPRNGFISIRLLLDADPDKTPEWRAMVERAVGKKIFAASYLLERVSYSGDAVYADIYSKTKHYLSFDKEPDRRFGPIVIGWDFAGNHSNVAIQRQGAKVVVLAEWPNQGFGTRRIYDVVMNDCYRMWGTSFTYYHSVDPSGINEGKSTDEKSCTDIIKELLRRDGKSANQLIIPYSNKPKARIDSVIQCLLGKPLQLEINNCCTFLEKGFSGGYCWPENQDKGKSLSPDKNQYSHTHDALQYAIMAILKKRKQSISTSRAVLGRQYV